MRFLLLLPALLPAVALAALPTLSTDTLARGEKALGMSFSQADSQADWLVSQGGNSFPGTNDGDSESYGANLSYGLLADTEVGLFVGRSDSNSQQTVYAVNTIETSSHTEGWHDLFWYTQRRFGISDQTAWSVTASGTVPTASDAETVPRLLVNGTVMPPAQHTGGAGHGYSNFSLSGNFSHRADANALEAGVAWYTDDERSTSDAFAISGALVHFPGTGGSRVSLGLRETFHGTRETSVSRSDSFNSGAASLSLTLRLKEDAEIGVGAEYTLHEESSTYYPQNGVTISASDANRFSFGVNLRVLMY